MQIAWKVWLTIGSESTKPPTAGLTGDKNDMDIFIPSQAYLTALIQRKSDFEQFTTSLITNNFVQTSSNQTGMHVRNSYESNSATQ